MGVFCWTLSRQLRRLARSRATSSGQDPLIGAIGRRLLLLKWHLVRAELGVDPAQDEEIRAWEEKLLAAASPGALMDVCSACAYKRRVEG